MTEKEERHLETKIRMTEDRLLRSNDPYEIEDLRNYLMVQRKKLNSLQMDSRRERV